MSKRLRNCSVTYAESEDRGPHCKITDRVGLKLLNKLNNRISMELSVPA